MNCEDVLAALETGGFLARLGARRHLRGCTRCMAAYAALGRAKRRLAAPEPLSHRARERWERAADESISDHRRAPLWIPLAAGLVAACVVLLAIKTKIPVQTNPLSPPVVSPAAPQVVVEEVDLAGELARLTAAVERLDEQVKRLKEQAVRRDAQREVAIALDRFSRW